jgi:hypothetical protein
MSSSSTARVRICKSEVPTMIPLGNSSPPFVHCVLVTAQLPQSCKDRNTRLIQYNTIQYLEISIHNSVLTIYVNLNRFEQ